MSEPNMTIAGMDNWVSTKAYTDYRDSHPNQDTGSVIRRSRKVIRGTATEKQVQKVESFISRTKAQSAGKRVNGLGPKSVSNRTAALRNWGYDPSNNPRFTG